MTPYQSRGFAFVTFVEENGAEKCKAALDQREFMGRKLHVNVSIPATRLFIGSIPKDKTKEEFIAELGANNVEQVKATKHWFIVVMRENRLKKFATHVATKLIFLDIRFLGFPNFYS
jgi:RNA recognition motif-containing protein